jgi:ABC-2 type transport system permease protein
MAANAELFAVREQGWQMGFANLLRKEAGAWWRTRMWIIQSLIWLAILNGMVAIMLWGVPDEAARSEAAAEAGVSLDRVMETAPMRGMSIFLIFGGIALPIAGLIVGQDALIDEKKSGTAAWVLSKPVSRPAFVLTKLIAHAFGFLVTGIVLQGVVAYLQISAAANMAGLARPPLLGFAGALGLVYLNLLFYLTLTLMLGAFFAARGPVLGIGFGLLFGYQIFVGLANGLLAYVGPWGLVVQTPITPNPLSLLVALGQPLPTVVPIVTTALWCVVFTVLAVWRFAREEF